MSKSHYDVLGVESDATSQEIKDAFRREAKRLHPDRYDGDGGSEPFRVAREAYEVLCDPVKRRAYDRELHYSCAELGTSPPRSRQPYVDTLIPNRPATAPHYRSGRAATGRSDWPGLTSRLLELLGWSASPRRARVVDVDVPLSPAQARRGGPLRLLLPVETRCPACGGTGYDVVYYCAHCEGHGSVEQRLHVEVLLPAGLREGETLRASLADVGMPGVELRLHFYSN